MHDNKRVFITGLGAVTAVGHSAEQSWQAIKEGKNGIAKISQWDLGDWPACLGGEIKDLPVNKLLPERKLAKVISRQDAFGLIAVREAIEHSELLSYRDSLADPVYFNDQTAVYVGSPGNKYCQQYDFLPLLAQAKGKLSQFGVNLFNVVHPMWLLRILPNNVLAYTGISYGFKGPNHNFTNHGVGGSQAILEAYNAIKTGQIQRAVVVAYDLGIEPQSLFYYDKLGLISYDNLSPFDAKHNGTILADGAGAIILESEASANARQAKCYSELVAGFAATEGESLFNIDREGKELASLLSRVLAAANMRREEIDLIVGHGNGNPKSDDSEIAALQKIFGNAELSLTAFKWAFGHTISASGMLDLIFTNYALNEQCIPGVANFQQPALCQNFNISAETRYPGKLNTVLMINRGFAAMNACMLVRSCV